MKEGIKRLKKERKIKYPAGFELANFCSGDIRSTTVPHLLLYYMETSMVALVASSLFIGSICANEACFASSYTAKLILLENQ